MSTANHRSTAALVAFLAAILCLAVIGSGKAEAAVGINGFFIKPSTTQAGGHPDVEIFGAWKTRDDEPKDPCSCDDARRTLVHFPTGFIGNPHATRTCTFAEFSLGACPSDSQVGAVILLGGGYLPLYNMETHPDQAGLTAFLVPLVVAPVLLELSARTDRDYGLDAVSSPVFHFLPVPDFTIHLWGVPAAPSHDPQRFMTPFQPGSYGWCYYNYPGSCPGMTGIKSNLAEVPYLENPTSCGVPLTSGFEVEYFNNQKVGTTAPFPATTGCDLLAFNPSLTAQPTTGSADSASGLDVDLKVPQTTSPSTPAPSEIKATSLTLPPGFSINPNAADGKTYCTDSQGAFGTLGGAQCPEHSKIGTSVLNSSALPEPINGAIYLGEPKPGDKYRIFLTADGYGTHVKLAGSVKPSPDTGQISVSFPDLPQSPFSEFNLHFFGSERGLLATPDQCGTYEVHSDFVPWDAILQEQHTTSFFTITSGPDGKPCPNGTRPFAPDFTAAVLDNTAGRHAPFVLRLSRRDGEQNVSGLDVSPPPGLLAKLKGVTYCPESALARLALGSYSGLAEQESPACPGSSRVGDAWAESGAGTHPLTSPGQVYLAGPYKGAPLSLVVSVPAVSGPYDLGNVVVRSAVKVDPTTARISTASDPIPQIIDGIPLRLRSIMIALNRGNFTVNPTDCSPMAVSSTAHGSEGANALLREHFQVSNCATLPFKPKLKLKLTGGMKRAQNPALSAVLTAGAGEANVERAVVTMPRSALVDNSHLDNVCTRVQYAADRCPAGSVYGRASVTTPLLEKPLEGNVYLRSSSRGLPDLVAQLRGQIDIDLVGHVDSARGGAIRTSFESVPDAPISRFVLKLEGGEKGLIENGRDLCATSGKAQVKMKGQNGMAFNRRVALGTPCKKKSARRARHGRKGAGK
jgi:hypothetical protein